MITKKTLTFNSLRKWLMLAAFFWKNNGSSPQNRPKLKIIIHLIQKRFFSLIFFLKCFKDIGLRYVWKCNKSCVKRLKPEKSHKNYSKKQGKTAREIQKWNRNNEKFSKKIFKNVSLFLFFQDHPNIIKLYETYEDQRNVYLVME